MSQDLSQTTDRSWMSWSCSAHATEADRRNARRMNVWTAVWVGIYLVALKVLESRGDPSLLVSAAALLVAGLAAIPFIRSSSRFLREADELTRLIHLQAAAVAFGVGALASLYERFFVRILELLGVSAEHVSDLVEVNPLLPMIVAFAIALRTLVRRFSR